MKRLRQSGSARRILRRKSSPSDFDESLADIVAPRMAEPVEAGDPHVDDPTDAADEKGSIVWYADAQQAVMKQCSDGKLMRADEWTDHRGFRRYHFADKTWFQTEITSLQPDEDKPLIKRPAAAHMRPAASTRHTTQPRANRTCGSSSTRGHTTSQTENSMTSVELRAKQRSQLSGEPLYRRHV